MTFIKISAISYLNTLPFLYGLKRSAYIQKNCTIDLDIPSVCAEKIFTGKADIGIVPVAILPGLKNYQVISDFCIGAMGNVKSVLLLSDVPLNQIKYIVLDYQSRTSVLLVKILASKLWNISPVWVNGKAGYESDIRNNTAAVVIGDRAMKLADNFNYAYDLSSEWHKMTGLPFVFACWISVTDIDEEFKNEFNKALKSGLTSIKEVIENYKNEGNAELFNLEEYYTQNVSYSFNEEKKKAMELFFHYVSELNNI